MAHHPSAENHGLPSSQASLGSILPCHKLGLALAELFELAVQIRNCLLRHNKTRGMSAIQYSGVRRLRCIGRQVWAEIIRLVTRKGALRVFPSGEYVRSGRCPDTLKDFLYGYLLSLRQAAHLAIVRAIFDCGCGLSRRDHHA